MHLYFLKMSPYLQRRHSTHTHTHTYTHEHTHTYKYTHTYTHRVGDTGVDTQKLIITNARVSACQVLDWEVHHDEIAHTLWSQTSRTRLQLLCDIIGCVARGLAPYDLKLLEDDSSKTTLHPRHRHGAWSFVMINALTPHHLKLL